jgi:hypothetical protein
MLRLSKIIPATALGLMISLSLVAPSAFAQSVNQDTANRSVVAQEAHLSAEAGYGNNVSDSNYQGHGGENNNHGNNRIRRVRCVRTSRWVRTRRGSRRVWYRVCRRY